MKAAREVRDCGDCGAKPGDFHLPGCDVERCRLCGGQSISCACNYPEDEHGETRDMTDAERVDLDERVEKAGGRLPWTGIWPGVEECRELGLWCKWVEPGWAGGKILAQNTGWVRCSADDPDATEDLNRLAMMPWDVKKGRRVGYN